MSRAEVCSAYAVLLASGALNEESLLRHRLPHRVVRNPGLR
eukprot:COSAG04_NODE_16827_length_487_cov_1.847938_2_plen_40_part_01